MDTTTRTHPQSGPRPRQDLARRRRGRAGIDFEVPPGEVFGLLGPNGAGKSTTIGMLTTTIVPTAGRRVVGGHDVAEPDRGPRRERGRVPGRGGRPGAAPDGATSRIHARLWGVDAGRRDGADRRARRRLRPRRPPRPAGARPTAAGQRRRLEIARALVSEPEVLFLDEPTVGLDPRIRYELLDVIAGLRGSVGVTVLLTTHYLDEAERLCDRVGDHARRADRRARSPAALLAGARSRDRRAARRRRCRRRRSRCLRGQGVAGDDAFAVGATLTVPVRGRSATPCSPPSASSGSSPPSISTRPPTLDDVYLRLTGDQLAA